MKSATAYKIVEYIKRTDFPYSPEDVAEDLDGVLADYGFCEHLDAEARAVLMQELLAIAEAQEQAESARLVLRDAAELGLLQPWYTQQVSHRSADDSAWLATLLLLSCAGR